jgi:hypothetical protein
MSVGLRSFAVTLFCLASLLAAGCGGRDAPATPAALDQQPTSEEPPPGEKEPTLPEGGP